MKGNVLTFLLMVRGGQKDPAPPVAAVVPASGDHGKPCAPKGAAQKPRGKALPGVWEASLREVGKERILGRSAVKEPEGSLEVLRPSAWSWLCHRAVPVAAAPSRKLVLLFWFYCPLLTQLLT